MRLGLMLLLGLFGCTQHNPESCCSTPSQCASYGLPDITPCETNKLCDMNGACVQKQCAMSSECDAASAPYCAGGLCSSQCSDDAQCPGAGQSFTHCEQGACVECRVGMNDDCPATAPVCDTNACRACKAHGECASGACASDGTCVAEAAVAYVTPTGSASADCSRAAPCTFAHAIAIGRTYTVIASGTYTNTQPISVSGTQWLIGSGTRPVITTSVSGAVLTLAASSTVHLDNLQISGATNGPGIDCPNDAVMRTLDVQDVIVTANSGSGIEGDTCSLTAARSSFTHNGGHGVFVKDYSATLERVDCSYNAFDGFNYDGTFATVANSFFIGNTMNGVTIFTGFGGGAAAFNTLAVNGKYALDITSSVAIDTSNNLMAKNVMGGLHCNAPSCIADGSITLTMADLATGHFKAPNVAPYDYHITHGSVAIDAASGGTLDHDFDGDVRPKGSARDVGADEAE